METNGIVTLITDFGNRDGYVGSMKGVMLSVKPGLILVDITHSIPPQDIKKASFVLYRAYKHFPKGTVHLVVVDPTVGTDRNPIIVCSDEHIFVAPDNGVLSLILKEKFDVYRINQGDLESTTFHGRDLFAPVAAKLASGVNLSCLSKEVSSIVRFPFGFAKREGDIISGEVIDIDHFGNVITNITRFPKERFTTQIKGRSLNKISSTYEGEKPIAIWGSLGFLEFSFPGGSLASMLCVKRGDKVIIKFKND